MHDDIAEIGTGVKGFVVGSDIEHTIYSGDINQLTYGLIHLIHREKHIVSPTDDDGYNMVLEQLGEHLVEGEIGVVNVLAGFNVA